MNGNQGHRAIEDFGEVNQAKPTELFKIENKQLLLYSTIKRTMMALE